MESDSFKAVTIPTLTGNYGAITEWEQNALTDVYKAISRWKKKKRKKMRNKRIKRIKERKTRSIGNSKRRKG